jgi:hypothetical protein
MQKNNEIERTYLQYYNEDGLVITLSFRTDEKLNTHIETQKIESVDIIHMSTEYPIQKEISPTQMKNSIACFEQFYGDQADFHKGVTN